MFKFFRRWALHMDETALSRDCAQLRRELDGQREEVEQLRSRNRVQQLEIDELAAVVARNIARVQAETAAAAAGIARVEGGNNAGRFTY